MMDLNLLIRREQFTDQATLGSLYLAGLWECFTLEDRVRADPDLSTPQNEAKVYGETAIPVGKFRMVLSLSPRLKIVTPELLDVPGFSGIRVHVLNRPEETLGCIGVGQGRADGRLVRSQLAFDALMGKLRRRAELGDRMWATVE